MILLGSDPLSQFLLNAEDRRFVWGEWDCLQWLAFWLMEAAGNQLKIICFEKICVSEFYIQFKIFVPYILVETD